MMQSEYLEKIIQRQQISVGAVFSLFVFQMIINESWGVYMLVFINSIIFFIPQYSSLAKSRNYIFRY